MSKISPSPYHTALFLCPDPDLETFRSLGSYNPIKPKGHLLALTIISVKNGEEKGKK